MAKRTSPAMDFMEALEVHRTETVAENDTQWTLAGREFHVKVTLPISMHQLKISDAYATEQKTAIARMSRLAQMTFRDYETGKKIIPQGASALKKFESMVDPNELSDVMQRLGITDEDGEVKEDVKPTNWDAAVEAKKNA